MIKRSQQVNDFGATRKRRWSLGVTSMHLLSRPLLLLGTCGLVVLSACGGGGGTATDRPTAANETSNSSARAATGPSDEELTQEIWAAYKNLPGNQDSGQSELHFREAQVHGQLVRKGTVLPKAMNSSVDERLPAYLACYDFIHIMTSNYGGADSKANLCIYLIKNPVTETNGLMWRGKDNLYELESKMSADGFVGTGAKQAGSDQGSVAATAVPPAPSPPVALASPANPALVQDGSAPEENTEVMTAADTVRAFYMALGRGDGSQANSFMSLEKRAAPSYQPDAIEAFYGHMAEPLTLVSVSAVGAGDYEVRYRYRKQSAVCNGHAIVTTQNADGRNVIARIKPMGNC